METMTKERRERILAAWARPSGRLAQRYLERITQYVDQEGEVFTLRQALLGETRQYVLTFEGQWPVLRPVEGDGLALYCLPGGGPVQFGDSMLLWDWDV